MFNWRRWIHYSNFIFLFMAYYKWRRCPLTTNSFCDIWRLIFFFSHVFISTRFIDISCLTSLGFYFICVWKLMSSRLDKPFNSICNQFCKLSKFWNILFLGTCWLVPALSLFFDNWRFLCSLLSLFAPVVVFEVCV